jgi:hypothetical protein
LKVLFGDSALALRTIEEEKTEISEEVMDSASR